MNTIIKVLQKSNRTHSTLLCPNIIPKCSTVIKRYFKPKAAYEGEGKTVMRLLNQEADLGLMINSYSQVGFTLNNGVTTIGPTAVFPRTVLSWRINSTEDINDASLSLFYTLDPKIDILVLGTGLETVPAEFYERIMRIMKKRRINVEILRTEQACTTFNFLNAESRNVAAALMPPMHLTNVTDDDIVSTKRKHDTLHAEKDDAIY